MPEGVKHMIDLVELNGIKENQMEGDKNEFS
jgi:hypothetical protein